MDIGRGALLVNTRTAGNVLRLGALLLCGAIAGCAGASGSLSLPYGKIDFEFTGTVFDAVTKQPIEGAYVFASYREPVGVNSRCYKTRGMYTGKDGKYRFPIEKMDGYSPWFTSAIKPGYFFGSFDTPKRDVWNRQDASSYADRNLYLIPQDPAKPSSLIGSGEERCHGARTKVDAAAGAHFLRIELSEKIRFGASEEVISATKEMINYLETLPSDTVGAHERNAGGQR
jgi:hypothetical protein